MQIIFVLKATFPCLFVFCLTCRLLASGCLLLLFCECSPGLPLRLVSQFLFFWFLFLLFPVTCCTSQGASRSLQEHAGQLCIPGWLNTSNSLDVACEFLPLARSVCMLLYCSQALTPHILVQKSKDYQSLDLRSPMFYLNQHQKTSSPYY